MSTAEARSAGPFDLGRLDFERDGATWPNRAWSRFVDAAGLVWHLQEMGEGPTVLLLHGTAGSLHSWRDVMPRLARRFHVIAVDLPGHGFTEPVASERLSLDGMAKALGALLLKLGTTPDLAVGHSAGAAILVRMALDRTIRPAAIVGFNAALMPFDGMAQVLFPPMAKLLVLNPLVPRVFAWTATEASVRRLIERTGSSIDAAGLAAYARLVGSPSHVGQALGMMARWDLDPLLADLPKLATRLDLVVATGDLAVPPTDAYAVRRRLPAARIHALPGLGHLAHEEDPAGAVALLERIAAETGILDTPAA